MVRYPFATHPLTEPVTTLAQAQAVLDERGQWFHVTYRAGVRTLAALLPGVADEPDADWSGRLRLRTTQALALRLWHACQAMGDAPELGLSALSDLTGFTVHYWSRGPDEAPDLGLALPTFSTPATADQEALRKAAFNRLRQQWTDDAPDSPLLGMLRLLADREPQQCTLDLTSHEALLHSLLTPRDLELYLDQRLPGQSSDVPRPRM